MDRVFLKELSKKKRHIPQATGYFTINNQDETLFVKSTENLQRFICFYCDSDTNVPEIQALIADIDYIEYKETSSLIEAFLEEQMIIKEMKPKFNKIIKPWYNYVYLGVDFDKPPYFKITNDTTEDFYYIGPFRSSFWINDVLDTFADLFKIPRCDNPIENRGCERLVQELCLGFCQNKLGEALPEMIKKMILMPNKELITKLEIECEALFNDLEYQKGEEVKEQIRLLKRYYKHIMFFYTSQFIKDEFEVKERKIDVDNGMISRIDDISFISCITKDDSKKENETLAYEKSEFDHRWIVFDFIFNTVPERLLDYTLNEEK